MRATRILEGTAQGGKTLLLVSNVISLFVLLLAIIVVTYNNKELG